MPLTLAQAKELSQDKLTDVVIDEFAKSPLMAALIFDNTVKAQGGKSMTYAYNRITTQPTAGSRLINGEYTAQETVTSQQVVNLQVMGGAYEIDRVIANDEVQVVNEVEFQSAQKSKATVAEFHNQFINGDATGTPGEFDGLEQVITGSTTVTPAAAIDLSTAANIKTNYGDFLYSLRKLVSKMDGSPTHLLMNVDAYAVFQSLSDIVPNISFSRDELGNEIGRYGSAVLTVFGDKPGTTTPIIGTKTTDVPVGSIGTTTVYAVRLALDGVHGVSPDGNDLVKTYLPDMTAPGAVKKGEVEFVGASVVKTTKAAGKLTLVKVA